MSIFSQVRSFFSFLPQNIDYGGAFMNDSNRPPELSAPQDIPDDADQTILYRTSDGSRDIKFWFKNCGDNSWRIYIMTNIDYNGRATDAHSTHRFYDSTLQMHYICWSQPICSKAGCYGVAKSWGDATLRYINEGRNFG